MLERLRKEPELFESVGVLHEQLTGGQPELLEHRSGGVELRDTLGQEASGNGYPGSVLGNEGDVQRAHLFGRVTRHVEQGKGLLEATAVCLKESEVRCRLQADLCREIPVLQQSGIETCGHRAITLVGEQRGTLAGQFCGRVGRNERLRSVEVAAGGCQAAEFLLNGAASDEDLSEDVAQSVIPGDPGGLVEQSERVSVLQGIALRPARCAKRQAEGFGVAALARLPDETC